MREDEVSSLRDRRALRIQEGRERLIDLDERVSRRSNGRWSSATTRSISSSLPTNDVSGVLGDAASCSAEDIALWTVEDSGVGEAAVGDS